MKDGIPKAGSRLRVRWDEDSEYSCIFLGSTKSYIYNVSKFELKKNSIENWNLPLNLIVKLEIDTDNGKIEMKKSHKDLKEILEQQMDKSDEISKKPLTSSRRTPTSAYASKRK